MNLNFNAIWRVTGVLFIIIGLSMIPSLITSLIYSETSGAIAFLITMTPTIIVGLLSLCFTKVSDRRLKVRDGILIVSIAWLSASLIGAVPFILSGCITSFPDAFFETASGFSTTGASILTDIEALPKGLLFWRSFTHWMGGMGILIFTIALMPALGISGQILAKAEVTGPTLDKLSPKMTDTAKRLYLIYIAMTAAEVVMLLIGKMSLYDALINTFGSVGTGGFSNYNASIAHYSSVYIELVITFFMILAGISFHLYFRVIQHGLKEFLKDSEFRFFIGIIGVFTILIGANLWSEHIYSNPFEAIRFSLFQVSSIITTTGFATTNYDLWPTFSKMLLLLLMFVGGCSSSTGGGVKVIRILVILKLIRRGLSVRLHPNVVVGVRIREKTLSADVVTSITGFVFLYIVVFFISCVAVSLDGYDMITSISAVAACLGNVGPGFNLVGPIMNYSFFSAPIKFLLSLLMLAGRLELFTMFLLLTPRFWNPDR